MGTVNQAPNMYNIFSRFIVYYMSEELSNILIDMRSKLKPRLSENMKKNLDTMSESNKLLFNLMIMMEDEYEKHDIAKIKKAVSEFTKQVEKEEREYEERRKAKEERKAQRIKRDEEKRLSEMKLPDLEDLPVSTKSRSRSISTSRSSGGKRKNNKTKKHKK
jgi:Skp family chaperone for outer membrane proteins